jgi:Zn-dependent protease
MDHMFRLLGFDVRVRAGFVIFLALIVFIYQGEQRQFGIWLAGSIAVLTLLHELGHAVAARNAGAEASISLDFLAGYTSFRPNPQRPISLAQQAVISVAGPATQILISLFVLLAMGVNPTSFDSLRQSDAAAAIFWAGPVIGALNLIPVLPLDGGHLAMTGLERFLGDRALRVMVIASIALTGSAAVLMIVTGHQGFALFVGFLLLNQLQLLQATGKRTSAKHPAQRLHAAEAAAWQTGRPGMLEPGQRLSPWYEAHRALAMGDVGRATAAIINDLRSDRPPKWSPPVAASMNQLRAIVDVLPEDLPHGNPYSERMLADILLATGHATRAGKYAVAGYSIHRSSALATVVARSAAQLGELTTAMQWLAEAEAATLDEEPGWRDLLTTVIDQAPEFAPLRDHSDFRAVRTRMP